jgi:hypothetical protein
MANFLCQRRIAVGVPQGSVLAPVLSSLLINDGPEAPGTHLTLFTYDTSICVTEKYERRVLCKLQRGLTAVNSWRERWNIKMNEGKPQAIYFSRRRSVTDYVLQLNGQNISFANNVMYLGFTLNKRMTWRHHIEKTVDKALRQ